MERAGTAPVVTDFSTLCVSCVPLNPLPSLRGIRTRSVALPPLLYCHPVWPSATLTNCTYIKSSPSRFFLSEFLTLSTKRLRSSATSEITQRQCHPADLWVYVWTERKNQKDATIIVTSVWTCFGHHYAHLQEIKEPVTAFGVLFWFCWMWLVAVVGRCLEECEHYYY
jgi:hypothetical protein